MAAARRQISQAILRVVARLTWRSARFQLCFASLLIMQWSTRAAETPLSTSKSRDSRPKEKNEENGRRSHKAVEAHRKGEPREIQEAEKRPREISRRTKIISRTRETRTTAQRHSLRWLDVRIPFLRLLICNCQDNYAYVLFTRKFEFCLLLLEISFIFFAYVFLTFTV